MRNDIYKNKARLTYVNLRKIIFQRTRLRFLKKIQYMYLLIIKLIIIAKNNLMIFNLQFKDIIKIP